MDRQIATKQLRDELDANSLQDWHIRLISDINKPFLGMCSYKDKTIILNALHVDTHPDIEVRNTILHEIAHAIVGPGNAHNEIWAAKAKSLGCDNTLPCASYGFSAAAIDAIRSGANLEVTFDEHIVRTPKYKVTRLQDKCPTCGLVAKTVSSIIIRSSGKRKLVTTLQCKHIVITDADSQSSFEDIIFDGIDDCKHKWNGTICTECNAKKLYPYQIEGARAIERANGRLAIFDEMGLGKTIQALAYFKFHPEALPFLWVTKSATKFQHGREIMRVLGKEYVPQIIMTGKEVPLTNIFKCFVVSYDIFRRTGIEVWKKAGIQTIVLDEVQAIKNVDSTRTQLVRQIAKEIPRIIPLSGTFWKNRGSEAFVALNLLDPKRFYSYENFKRNEVLKYYVGNREKEGGLRKGFIDTISHIAIRRERKDVLPELPPFNKVKFIAEMPDYAQKVYDEESVKITNIMNTMAIDGTDSTFQAKKELMASIMVMRQIVGIAKVPATVELAQEFLENTDRKLVIFVHHIKCGEMIYEQMKTWCAENDFPMPLKITGGMGSIERIEAQDKFNGPNYRLLIASTLAAGEGMNLQSCSDSILHERQWNPANELQAVEGRFARIGQKAANITCTFVHGKDSVDTEFDAIVEGKLIMFHNSMNKGQLPTWSDDGMLMELSQAIANKVNATKKRK